MRINFKIPIITTLQIILLIVILLEVGMFTFHRNIFGLYISPVVILFISGFISIFPIYIYSRAQKLTPTKTNSDKKKIINFVIVFLMFFIGGLFIWYNLIDIMKGESGLPWSDVIPTIEKCVERFLTGEIVYEPIKFTTHTVYPGMYLPFRWLPFVISKILNFDLRWLAYIFFIIGIFLYELSLAKQNIGKPELIIKSLLPFLFLYFFIITRPQIFGLTTETLIVGYYLILFNSIFSKSVIFRAIGLLLCLLSRFSLLFWIPFYLVSIFLYEKKKNAIAISLYILLGTLGFYIIPFLSANWNFFFDGLNYYTEAVTSVWNLDTAPQNTFRGIGMASFFYEFTSGTTIEKVHFLQNFHIIVSVGSVVLLSIFYFIKWKKSIDYKFYCLLGLKFCFVFLYGFVVLPYIYMFLVPVFLSLVILSYNYEGISKNSLLKAELHDSGLKKK